MQAKLESMKRTGCSRQVPFRVEHRHVGPDSNQFTVFSVVPTRFRILPGLRMTKSVGSAHFLAADTLI